MQPTVWPRSAWVDPLYPVTGPALPWTKIDTIAPHYTAAVNLIDGDLGEFQYNIPPYLRAIQRDYLNRDPVGYSIGYNWAIDWLGGIWECRGWNIKSAAQGFPLNDNVVAVLLLVDGNDAPTLEAQASFRFLNSQARSFTHKKLIVMDHGRLPGAATACAGAGIRATVDAGFLDDEYSPFPPPPEEDEMQTSLIHVASASKGEWFWQPGFLPKPFESPQDRDNFLAATGAKTWNCSDDQLFSLFDQEYPAGYTPHV